MNIDELARAIRFVSNGQNVQRIADCLLEWKQNEETANDLNETIERLLGNSWIKKDKDYDKIYRLWNSFRNEAITGIGGMTMNERLYHFCLFDEFDNCRNQKERLKIYSKLLANP